MVLNDNGYLEYAQILYKTHLKRVNRNFPLHVYLARSFRYTMA